MAQTLAPDIRSQFAKRLKNIRTLRGFGRARYFARSLGIEENRYTRYERAEVEPSLTLIHKMCQTLHVTPNELLGFGDAKREHKFAVPGLADPSLEEIAQASDARAHGADNEPKRLSSLAWRLASETVAIRSASHGKSKAVADPFDTFRETFALLQRLQSEPFATAGEIVEDPAVKAADAGRKAALADLIKSYTESVSQAGSPAPAR